MWGLTHKRTEDKILEYPVEIWEFGYVHQIWSEGCFKLKILSCNSWNSKLRSLLETSLQRMICWIIEVSDEQIIRDLL